MLTPDQFEVNDAWITVRINEEFLFVKEDPYDMFVLMDVTPQCELIGLARCSYYRISSNGQESPENLELMRRIDIEYI